MPEMTPDEEWSAVTHPDRSNGPAQRREMDSLSDQMAQILEGLGKANHGIEGAKKNLSGIWGLVLVGVFVVWWIAQFVQGYQQTLTAGSPALIKAVGELNANQARGIGEVKAEVASMKKVDDDRYDTLNAILQALKANNEMMDRRVSRLEDKR